MATKKRKKKAGSSAAKYEVELVGYGTKAMAGAGSARSALAKASKAGQSARAYMVVGSKRVDVTTQLRAPKRKTGK